MAQYNQTEKEVISSNISTYEPLNKDADSKGVVDMAKYKQPDEKVSSETSAFEQVMSQMNIADRHAFDMQYDKFWAEASDESELLSVLICEIDFFKAYNDNYGHQASAFMLLVIGLALKNTCEEFGCFLARYRGDEFAILIKGGDVKKTRDIAETLRQAVEKSRTEHNFSDVSDIVTLSIGISSIFPTSMKILMNAAGSALTSAKVSGYNQVCGHVEPEDKNSALIPVSDTRLATQIEEQLDTEKDDFERLMSEMNIFDRRDFNGYFVKTWQEASRGSELLSMVMCEIDFFQAFMDNYEKETSYDVLLIVACTLKSKCEEFDCFVARLEGAKFAILIKGGNATKGLKVAESIRVALEELNVEHAHSPVKNALTMSMGLSNIFPSEMNSMKMLMAKVDSALSDAKASGHDQISVN
ncbi:diguanylate cyclase domain-containing protein [Psychromonas ossibalaenae]|uniref:diguanylate cyclase domain-containing protein n=1 Tax=Psychromonas ossibalaenae TaxID=444922 RepID=UPI00037F8EE4|nr:diguanylate cyclase [Psychromonas ossibalaenae]